MKSLSLYFSAFVPMYILLILQNILEIINGNRTLNALNTISLVIFSSATIWGVVGLIYYLKRAPKNVIKIKVISSTNIADQHFFSYISVFILFTLGFDISKMAMFATTIIILAIIGIVYIHNKIFYINPLLNILGFSFFEIEYITEKSNSPQTAKVFYYGHHNLKDKWVQVSFESTNFTFIDTKNK